MMDDSLQISAGESVTRLEHPQFEAQLPFHWQQIHADGIQLVNQSLPEQLFIRVINAGAELPPAMRITFRDELLQAQQRAMSRLAPELASARPQLHETEDLAEARLLGRNPQQQMLLAFMVRVCARRALTTSLYRYTLQDTGTDFSTYAATIFEHLRLK